MYTEENLITTTVFTVERFLTPAKDDLLRGKPPSVLF